MKEDKIYFATSGGRIKIGIAKDVERRLRQIDHHLPETLNLLGTIDGGAQTESSIHERLKPFHVKGEWFRFGPEVQKIVSEILNAPVRDWIFVTGRQHLKLDKRARDPAVSDLMIRARAAWPKCTARQMAECAGVSERACKSWLSGHNNPSGRARMRLEGALGGAAIGASRSN